MNSRRRFLVGGAVGAAVRLLLVLWIEVSGPGRVEPAPALLLPVGLAVVGLLAVGSYEGGQPFVLREWIPFAPKEIHRHATRWYAASGSTMRGGTGDALAFTRGGFPDPNAGCLLLLGVLPFLLMAEPLQTATIQTTRVVDGTDLDINVSPRGAGGRASAVRFFNSLHDPR